MARLPIVGQDEDHWGEILGEFLEVAHNPDGTLREDATEWGDVGGDIANQVDLQDALDGKSDADHQHQGPFMGTIQIGPGASAEGQNSLAVGDHAQASGDGGVALGTSAQSPGESGVAMGAAAEAHGENSVAIGKMAYTASEDSGVGAIRVKDLRIEPPGDFVPGQPPPYPPGVEASTITLQSPDGTLWTIGVDNSGNLAVSQP